MAFNEVLRDVLLNFSPHMSSKKTRTNTSPVTKFLTGNVPKYTKSLNSYQSACQEDPDLKSFDSLLHERTSKLFSSIGKTGNNSSLDSLNEVCAFQVDLSRDVVKIIIDNKEELSNNEEIKSLVDLYFESTTKTLKLFNTVEKCVEKAKIIQLLIRIAIKEFETESMDTKYAETLEKLNKVKAMEDPFGEEFETQYKSIFEEQVMILNKFCEMQVMLEKKRKDVKKLRTLVNIVFATTLLSLIALSICLTVASLPVVATVVASVVATVVASVMAPVVASVVAPVAALVAPVVAQGVHTTGTWVIKMLKDYEKSVKSHEDLFLLTENSTKVNIRAMKTIKSLVETLIIKISSILKTLEVALEMREEEAVKLVMQEIIKEVEVFDERIKQVGAHVAECSESIFLGRVLVLKHIANSASLKGKR